MASKPRSEIFCPEEQAVVHVMNRCVRQCFLMGYDNQTKKDNSFRKRKFERELKKAAKGFGIDLLTYAIMDNHFHLILRSRPDLVAQWSDAKVVRQWHKLCPIFKTKKGVPIEQPSDTLVDAMASNTEKVKTWRRRLSDISWYMKLVSQKIAKWCNAQDGVKGSFWEARFKSVLLLDERALLTCSAYVDLNQIEAELAKSLDSSKYVAVQKRIRAEVVRTSMQKLMAEELNGDKPTTITATVVMDPDESGIPDATNEENVAPDAHLAPIEIDEKHDPIGPHLSQSEHRCSDKGYLPMSQAKYIELLNWSADQIRHRRAGRAYDDSPPLLKELELDPDVWCKLATQFTELFYAVAGMPESVDAHRSTSGKRFNMPTQTRELLST